MLADRPVTGYKTPMHILPSWLIIWQWCSGLLLIGVNAAAALPLITALTLLIGRRGRARFCAYGAGLLARLGFGLSWLGLPVMLGGLLSLLYTLRDTGYTPGALSPWTPVMLPYSLTLLLWLTGMLWAGLLSRACARAPLPPVRSRPEEDRYTAGDVKGRLWLCGLATLCFFATWISRYWPFAALPSGMDLGQAASVILADALHNYFMAFAPAGALALLFLLRARRDAAAAGFGEEELERAARWCALWATIGYIPFCLDRWGLALGYLLRGAVPDRLMPQIYALIPLTAAIACWGALLAMPRPLRRAWLIGLGLILLALKESLPHILRLAGHG
ncbi:spidroin-2 [Desulfovibrio sp.]|uniref:spidroin-2 n=1 Tax=Desulfovibrio sp. TaxID=885 RepID=UPI0025BF582D|nr:spidroin-2 [Desulfovibrio sp.]